MPKGTNQKFKLYRLAQIMLEKTDEEHYITMPEIMENLAEYDITADRKSIYTDLRDLIYLQSSIWEMYYCRHSAFYCHCNYRCFKKSEINSEWKGIQC